MLMMLIHSILVGSVNTVKRETESLVATSKEIGLAINTEKIKTCSFLEVRMQDEFTI
jgi:hypothetical protein